MSKKMSTVVPDELAPIIEKVAAYKMCSVSAFLCYSAVRNMRAMKRSLGFLSERELLILSCGEKGE